MSSEAVMTRDEYAAAKAEILNEAASMKDHARAQCNMELSRLYRRFLRAGWTLERIAEVEGISRQSVIQIIRSGEFEEQRSR
jgi:N-acyl-L-homoserine lactone synthetase